MTAADCFQIFERILGSLTSVVAILGVTLAWPLWRFQKRAERRMAVAESVLEAAANAIQAIEAIRSPVYLVDELNEAEEFLTKGGWDKAEHGEEEWSNIRLGAAALLRVKSCDKDFERLWSVIPLANVHFGHGVEKALKVITIERSRVVIHAKDLLRNPDPEDCKREHRRYLSSASIDKDSDPVKVTLEESFRFLERTLEREIKMKGHFKWSDALPWRW